MPSLSLADEAIELFVERARAGAARISPSPPTTPRRVAEICGRLDGMPLAIELAAARVRALSLTEILDSLHDRFRLLTGGARRAVRRQQSLGASVDWSHALLTEPERTLFRRLSVFMGGFDLDAAQEVCSGDALPRHQILDQLTLLVDKSLVVVESTSGRTRYRLAGNGAPVCAWRSSANRAKPTTSATPTATTTHRWPPSSTPPRRVSSSS